MKKVGFLAAVVGLGVVLLPWALPAGPGSSLDAAGLLQSGSWLMGAAVVFLGGLLTAMTPCVYPLIPITVSVFGARKAESRGKAMLLTGAYVVGMGVVFSALGVAAAKTGQAFGTVLGSPVVVTVLAAFLLALATSMFGAFELALPSSLQTRLNSVGGAGVGGAFLMGSASGFLAAPCTGPVLTALLAYVATSQSTALGAGLLFIYALGIGVPFFLIGAFTVQLPKGGVWMEWVKSLLGITLVALAALYLKDAFAPAREALADLGNHVGQLPGAWLAGALALVGVAVGAVHRSFKEGTREFLLKGVGVAVVVAALLLRVGALNASHRTGELAVRLGLAAPPTAPELVWDLEWAQTEGASAETFDAVLTRARSEGKPVMIDFFAEWCAACKELDRFTYVAPPVIEESTRFVNVKVNATNDGEAIESLYQRYGVQGLPAVVFISGTGEVREEPRITGFLEAQQFLAQMRKVR